MNLRRLSPAKWLSGAKWLSIAGSILTTALTFVLAGVFSDANLPWGNWHVILNMVLLLAVLGAYYGTIAVLDGDSDMAHSNRPVLRTLLCGALAATAVLLVQSWPPHTFNAPWAAVGFVLGAMLGWAGWAWAKFVDF